MSPKHIESPRRDEDSMEVEGYGLRAKVTGPHWSAKELYLSLLIITCTGLLLWERNVANKEFIVQHKITQAMLSNVVESQKEAIIELRKVAVEVKSGNLVQAYVLTLSQLQRERLNLSMPDELRSRIRNGTQ